MTNLVKARLSNNKNRQTKSNNEIHNPKKRGKNKQSADPYQTHVCLVCNGIKCILPRRIRRRIVSRYHRSAKPSCHPGTLAEVVGQVRGLDVSARHGATFCSTQTSKVEPGPSRARPVSSRAWRASPIRLRSFRWHVASCTLWWRR